MAPRRNRDRKSIREWGSVKKTGRFGSDLTSRNRTEKKNEKKRKGKKTTDRKDVTLWRVRRRRYQKSRGILKRHDWDAWDAVEVTS